MSNSIQDLKQLLSEAEVWDKTMEFKRWDFIKKENSTDTNLYFVDEGCIRVYFTEEAHEHSLYFGYEGSLISALDSFLSGNPSSLCIQCINKTKVRVISKTTFKAFLRQNSVASNLWMEALSELSLWHLEREKDLLIQSPKERYERILKRQPLLLQKVPHKYIASYLRISPETLSRILNS
ncbi:MAG: Crp/Fnr family transcriptional regulator [Flavobacteriales bacterium]|nr:Crp/Fnr family transcriptional regulator [Flavobacteriales bacterium]